MLCNLQDTLLRPSCGLKPAGLSNYYQMQCCKKIGQRILLCDTAKHIIMQSIRR